MTASQKRFRYLCKLHALAWLACDKFASEALGEAHMEKHDSDFMAKNFYPAKVLKEAKKALIRAFHDCKKKGNKK